MNEINVIHIKENKIALFKEWLKLNVPIVIVYLVIFITMLWYFRRDMYRSAYLFNWLTSAFCIVLAVVQIKNKEYWRRFNIAWDFNPNSWYMWPCILIIFGLWSFVNGIYAMEGTDVIW